MRALAAARGSELILDLGDDDLEVEADARRIDRILRNLLTNAIEHGGGRPVRLEAAGTADAVAVAVIDRGVGLDDAEAARVFDRFWRADPSRARTVGGTGLGLAISLEDAPAHGGRLQAWAAGARGRCSC